MSGEGLTPLQRCSQHIKPKGRNSSKHLAHSAGAEEYTDSISTKAGKTPPNKCPEYDMKVLNGYNTKQPDDEALVVLKFWRMQSTSSLPLLSGPL